MAKAKTKDVSPEDVPKARAYKGKLNSAVVIARLLSTEGFSDYTANEVTRYWKHRSGLTDRQMRQVERLEERVSEIMARLDVGDNLVIGKFIGLHKKMSFDTGVKIGLQAFATVNGKDIETDFQLPKSTEAK